MAVNRFVGSRLARLCAVALSLATVVLALAADTASRYVFYAALGAGLLTWMSLVHSFTSLFRLWMQFAEVLHTVVITTIFSMCYLVIVPVFRLVLWFRDPLHLRKPLQESSWVARTATVDAPSLERMG